MKTSFIIGWVALFVACVIGDSIIQQNTGFGTTQVAWINSLVHPQITNMTALYSVPVIGSAFAIITMVGTYIMAFISMIALWFPSIWTGTWLWVYYFVCLPVSIGFIVSIVFILRGVHNG